MESTSNQQQLTLHIPNVTSDLNNTEYTCVVNILLLPQEIEISVNKSFIRMVTMDSKSGTVGASFSQCKYSAIKINLAFNNVMGYQWLIVR